ncbi:TolC family protein [Agriterribacter sp.]|uniref:TolC family protein n=1 Tax=Agriterribacter sp. TaxID=2821509 RepID=UPI002C172854|nr:TolC family protein [Agriterribacter sp.]HRP56379.1 TolC family protein [Agriterribacter sp.]
MKPVLFLIVALTCLCQPAASQKKMVLSLQEAVGVARGQSLLAKQIEADYSSYVHRYQSFKASLKPQLSLDGTLPSYDRSLLNIVQPDGSYKVQSVRRSLLGSNLTVTQNIFWTGGNIYVSSGANLFTNKGTGLDQRQWQTAPFQIGIVQPLSLFNTVKWNFEQEKLRMKQATKQQIELYENLSGQITAAYFDLYVSEMVLNNARQNVQVNDTLYKISTGRFNVGRIAENELLQVELQLMNARNAVTQGEVNVQANAKRLANLLGLDSNTDFELVPVTDAPVFSVDMKLAVEEAKSNRSDMLGFDLQENNARRQVRQSQSNAFASGNIRLSYGLNQTAMTLAGAYQNPLDFQQVNIGYSLPLFGFGRSRHDIAASKANLESTQAGIAFQKKEFELEIENTVNQFMQLQSALMISAKSDTIAQKRYEVARNRYILGKISITDLGLAQEAKDNAVVDYVRMLQQYWQSYYDIRRVTLYDFEKNLPISN